MPSGSTYTNLFGGNVIRPSQPSYSALSISADTALVWPLETTGGVPSVSAQMDITATVSSLLLMMPPGNTGSNGAQAIVTNVGANTFTVTDQSGTPIAPIAAGQSWVITLTSNATPNGAWETIQLGATSSAASAAALAGPGLQAIASRLQTYWPTVFLNANTLITALYRSTNVVWQGGIGTLQLDTVANLTPGWFCGINNEGTGALTISTADGSTINVASTLVMQPGNSGIFICGPSNFNTLGALISTLSIKGGGTGATSAPQALINFGGTSVGTAIFTAPSAAAVVALLGLNTSAFAEVSISSDQVLTGGSSNSIFVCTAGLTLTLPLTTSLTTSFVFMACARGGNVALTPQAADTINGLSAGASLTIPQGGSVIIATDANGHWYTLFGPDLALTLLTVTGAMNVGGPVGIGTDTPGYQLDVWQTNAGVAGIRIYNPGVGGGVTAAFEWSTGTANSYVVGAVHENTGSPYWQLSAGSGIVDAYYDMPNHIFRSASGAEWMRMTGGNLGIGTTTPAVPLDVVGSGHFSTSLRIDTGAAGSGDSTRVTNLGDFPSSIGGAGWFQRPDGLIEQYTIGPTDTAGAGALNHSVSFPISFPNNCFQVSVSTDLSAADNGASPYYQTANWNTAAVTIQRQLPPGGGDPVNTRSVIRAIGN